MFLLWNAGTALCDTPLFINRAVDYIPKPLVVAEVGKLRAQFPAGEKIKVVHLNIVGHVRLVWSQGDRV